MSGRAGEKRGLRLTEGREEGAHDEEEDGVAMVSARGEVDLAGDVGREGHGGPAQNGPGLDPVRFPRPRLPVSLRHGPRRAPPQPLGRRPRRQHRRPRPLPSRRPLPRPRPQPPPQNTLCLLRSPFVSPRWLLRLRTPPAPPPRPGILLCRNARARDRHPSQPERDRGLGRSSLGRSPAEAGQPRTRQRALAGVGRSSQRPRQLIHPRPQSQWARCCSPGGPRPGRTRTRCCRNGGKRSGVHTSTRGCTSPISSKKHPDSTCLPFSHPGR
jgi:hypothetical protein